MLIRFYAIILVLLMTSCYGYADVIKPSNKGFQYTGRIDFSDINQPYLTWPGSTVKANITGNKLVVLANDDTGLNYFNVIINGQDEFPYILKLSKGFKRYDLSHLITSNITTVELFKRTEGAEGGTYFKGFEIAGDTLATPPLRLSRKMIFFGDSVTSGMGNESADNDIDSRPSDKNHYLSYAAISARELQAEFHTISRSGIGFMVSWFDFIMPDYYNQVTGVTHNDTQWDAAQWQPDVVVVNLGQNDYWLINQKRLQPVPTRLDIINAYANFMLKLSYDYPNAQFIAALGSMDITQNLQWPTYIEEAITLIKQKNKKIKINTIIFDFNGYKKHPRVQQHKQNAGKLTRKIKSLMKW